MKKPSTNQGFITGDSWLANKYNILFLKFTFLIFKHFNFSFWYDSIISRFLTYDSLLLHLWPFPLMTYLKSLFSSVKRMHSNASPSIIVSAFSWVTGKPGFNLVNGSKFAFCFRLISLYCYPDQQTSMTSESTNISKKLSNRVSTSAYRNGIIGFSVWYFIKKGPEIPAT